MFYKLMELLRVFKIDPSCRGVKYITEVLEGKMEFDDLNDDQIELIVDAWDSRTFIPEEEYHRLSKKDGVVKPENVNNLPREEYNRQVARNVIEFFR